MGKGGGYNSNQPASVEDRPKRNGLTTTADETHHPDKSLIIPITSTTEFDPNLFIEIFPSEIPNISSATLTSVLREEEASLAVWADAALGYAKTHKMAESAEVLSAACELEQGALVGGDRADRVRVLASAGIAHLTANQKNPDANNLHKSKPGRASEDERQLAEDRFTQATKIDQFFPMTWVGKAMLNLSRERIEQARFFFDTTLKQAGQVLPALLGMAAVKYAQGLFGEALDLYGRAIALYPETSGASVRVAFGLCCYQLGQVDRAKAAFKRAHEIDKDNVEAMAGCAVLELASLDETSKDYLTKQESAIRMISMANLIDRSNAMVQNHLADHYFWKWSQVPGTVSVTKGSLTLKGSQPINLDPGERIRIGPNFETYASEEENDGGGSAVITVKDPWNMPSAGGLKLWKKDYDRVVDMAKGALSSTEVPEVQAESYFLLARVYHVKADLESAQKYYAKACKLAPGLTPARFGWAQTLIWQGQFEEAETHLRLVLGPSPSATDAHAVLGLLEAKAGKDRKGAAAGLKKAAEDRKGALVRLKKAAELSPTDPELILTQALALQQHETDFPAALERYRKAVEMMEHQGTAVSSEVLTNIGVLCQETNQHDEALKMYESALITLAKSEVTKEGGDTAVECTIKHESNKLFWRYVDSGLKVSGSDVQFTVAEDSNDSTALVDLKVGDHVRFNKWFCSEIISLESEGNVPLGSKITLKDPFVLSDAPAQDKPTDSSLIDLQIKRSNDRLRNPLAVSIAFNMARLHEDTGRTVAAIELHKAIIKRHPSYVNCYLRLACIARDCGSLQDCSQWLQSAFKVDPGNPEVRTLVGNLHLSLCDWAPAQTIFDNLLQTKDPNVEAYSQLSMGNIYFSNLTTPGKFSKHLKHAADFFSRILNKDRGNFYAANGLGTVLAEKAELSKAREVFNRVREVSEDSIPDSLLNLGHIYLAQKQHPQALKMYQTYMSRTSKLGSGKSENNREDAEVLLYISFTYFDWGKQTELQNNSKAADSDERYQQCIKHIELAMKSNRDNLVLRYNLCMAKLQAAHCVLQKQYRNIPRTAQEVRGALQGLEESLPVVRQLLKWKGEGKKIVVPTAMLEDFIKNCSENIDSAKDHLKEEEKKENEAREMRELQRVEALMLQKERELTMVVQKEKEDQERRERERRARDKMRRVENLVSGWEKETKHDESVKAARNPVGEAPQVVDGFNQNEESHVSGANLFDSDSATDDDEPEKDEKKSKAAAQESERSIERPVKPATETSKDLFGDSSDDSSDEELTSSANKRGADSDDDEGNKRHKRG
eukprot:CAMPEP_0194425676 /NCGR_PEP_ID=MMETSP0176-20130528/24887_1 /TAXON_ID=216777 /ORGANISM="Proboscia alata, Strain PI-D3" /LENGTH=1293 /DNA_ID=CAMNT_0039236049 /DNA_START=225 /DNA_END=4106 /DNA_ORIENTATION=-